MRLKVVPRPVVTGDDGTKIGRVTEVARCEGGGETEHIRNTLQINYMQIPVSRGNVGDVLVTRRGTNCGCRLGTFPVRLQRPGDYHEVAGSSTESAMWFRSTAACETNDGRTGN